MDAETIAKGLSESMKQAVISNRPSHLFVGRNTVVRSLKAMGLVSEHATNNRRVTRKELTPLGLAVRAALLKDPNA